MRAYTSLARFYDSLTADVPYERFADFYEKLWEGAGVRVKTVLDLACGTGAMTRELTRRGYELISVDSSPDMLSIASEKTADCGGIRPVLICQPMEKLDLYGTVDAAVCTLDGVNYVKPDLLEKTFERVKLFLEPGGMFVFDINTPDKLRGMDGEVFLDETDDVFCVWRADFLKDENACLYGMDIFSQKGKLWRRDREEHVEYAHEPERLAEILRKTGFTEINVYGELRTKPPKSGEMRVFIAALKNEK